MIAAPPEPASDPPAEVERRTVTDLPVPDLDRLQRFASSQSSLVAHDAVFAATPALHAVEVRQPPGLAGTRLRRLRIAAWNLERCKHLGASAALLRMAGADVALLSEMDVGMGRSGQSHTPRDLADTLGFGYAFAVEFVELGHGIGRELEGRCEPNRVGLHGNAILSRIPFRDSALLRLDRPGDWFNRDWHHARIGGRIGLGSLLDVGGLRLPVASAHLENIAGPEDRRRQVLPILRWVAAMPPGCPAVVAGDFNTADLPDADSDPGWLEQAEQYEPLFGAMRAAGFDWRFSNGTEHGRREIRDGRPAPKPRRVDWIFVRGMRAADPRTWPAVDADGRAISDHDLLTVDLALDN